MKFMNAKLLFVASLCLAAGPVLAGQGTQATATPSLPATGAPVKLQPAPLPPQQTSEKPQTLPAAVDEARAGLGPEGLMFTHQRQGNAPVAQPTGDASSVAAIAPAAGGAATAMNADKPPRTIGGAQVLPARAIAENLAGPKNLTTLAKAMETSRISATLANAGPYTLFAPSNTAFNRLPKDAFNTLLAPQNAAKLSKLLNLHIVAGQHDAASMRADIAAGNGTANYDTLAGEKLAATIRGGAIVLGDSNGNTARIALADAYQSNGVLHIVDRVLIPQ